MKTPFRILVTDDNEINQQVVQGMLEHAGYLVDLAGNGREALERLSERHYDLLILDCMMPVMDGFETAQVIRSSSNSNFDSEIPILAVTALATREDQDRCLDCGMNDYIAKPVVADVLFARVERLLEDTQPVNKAVLPASESIRPESTGSMSLYLQHSTPTAPTGMPEPLRAAVIKDSNQWITELPLLQSSGKWNDLFDLAHKIRGTADLLNEADLSASARNLEACRKTGNLVATADLTQTLVADLQTLVSKMDTGNG